MEKQNFHMNHYVKVVYIVPKIHGELIMPSKLTQRGVFLTLNDFYSIVIAQIISITK